MAVASCTLRWLGGSGHGKPACACGRCTPVTSTPRAWWRCGARPCWRARCCAALRGATRGYRRHPQLDRFRAHAAPRQAINAYLAAVHAEALVRGYRFDRSRFGPVCEVAPLPLNEGQLELEWRHLLAKLAVRDPARCVQWRAIGRPDCHPLFRLQPGPVAAWERAEAARGHE